MTKDRLVGPFFYEDVDGRGDRCLKLGLKIPTDDVVELAGVDELERLQLLAIYELSPDKFRHIINAVVNQAYLIGMMRSKKKKKKKPK